MHTQGVEQTADVVASRLMRYSKSLGDASSSEALCEEDEYLTLSSRRHVRLTPCPVHSLLGVAANDVCDAEDGDDTLVLSHGDGCDSDVDTLTRRRDQGQLDVTWCVADHFAREGQTSCVYILGGDDVDEQPSDRSANEPDSGRVDPAESPVAVDKPCGQWKLIECAIKTGRAERKRCARRVHRKGRPAGQASGEGRPGAIAHPRRTGLTRPDASGSIFGALDE